MNKRIGVALAVWLCVLGGPASADESDSDSLRTDSLLVGAPGVYVDCDDCDFDFLREEVTFVNFVRDRKQSDVHILVSEQRTGSGGREYTIELIGQNGFAGMTDTLLFHSEESATEDDVRRGLAHMIQMGLVRFVAQTPLAEHVSVEFSKPSKPVEVVDRWNYWVFSIEGNIWFNGEESFRSISTYGEVDAQRITERSKIEMNVWANYNESRFTLTSVDENDVATEETVLSLSRSKGGNASVVWSLGPHWSWGLWQSAWSSTYSNRKLTATSSAGLEFNVYPYEESTRRQLRIGYWARVNHTDYEEETIFDKTEEWLYSQQLQITVELVQPWGSVNSSLDGSHFFHDFKKNRLQLWGNLSVRLVKGLSLNLNGSISRVRNQLSLRKGGASDEEVLLRRRELATDYSYWGSVGLSYSFGSIYNNIVNPRFGD